MESQQPCKTNQKETAVDVKSKQITGLEITDDKSHDSKHFTSLVEQSKQSGNVRKVLTDGAYDVKDNF